MQLTANVCTVEQGCSQNLMLVLYIGIFSFAGKIQSLLALCFAATGRVNASTAVWAFDEGG